MAELNGIKAVLAEQEKTGKWLAEQVDKLTYTVRKGCNYTIQPGLPTLDKISKLSDASFKDAPC